MSRGTAIPATGEDLRVTTSTPPRIGGEIPVRLAVVEQPRLRMALSPVEAAEALGCSRDFFDLHVLPGVRVVRAGRKVLVPIAELERWLDRNASLTLG